MFFCFLVLLNTPTPHPVFIFRVEKWMHYVPFQSFLFILTVFINMYMWIYLHFVVTLFSIGNSYFYLFLMGGTCILKLSSLFYIFQSQIVDLLLSRFFAEMFIAFLLHTGPHWPNMTALSFMTTISKYDYPSMKITSCGCTLSVCLFIYLPDYISKRYKPCHHLKDTIVIVSTSSLFLGFNWLRFPCVRYRGFCLHFNFVYRCLLAWYNIHALVYIYFERDERLGIEVTIV